jgi:hypothetical protein
MDTEWEVEAQNCSAPALDFLAAIVSSTGSEPSVTPLSGVNTPESSTGACMAPVVSGAAYNIINNHHTANDIRKSDSVKSFASQSSTTSIDSKRTPIDEELTNCNGKRTPSESLGPDAKHMKIDVDNSNLVSTIASISSVTSIDGGGSQSFSNLPMPSGGQIPQMNNNGQFNQNFDNARSGQVSSTGEGQNLGEGMQFPYYITDMQGSAQQNSLVYPVSDFSNASSGRNGVE